MCQRSACKDEKMRRTLLTLIPVLGLLMALAGLVTPVAASAHTRTVAVHIIPSSGSCFEDGCDGIFPSPGDEACTYPNRDQSVDMVGSHGDVEGHLYLYYTTGGSNCGYAVWGTAVLNSNLIFPNGISVYTTRTSSGEYSDQVGSYSENVFKGTYMDAPMVGYEPPAHACDSVNAAADWYDIYTHAEHTQTVSVCFN